MDHKKLLVLLLPELNQIKILLPKMVLAQHLISRKLFFGGLPGKYMDIIKHLGLSHLVSRPVVQFITKLLSLKSWILILG